jgi:hypothetical protein
LLTLLAGAVSYIRIAHARTAEFANGRAGLRIDKIFLKFVNGLLVIPRVREQRNFGARAEELQRIQTDHFPAGSAEQRKQGHGAQQAAGAGAVLLLSRRGMAVICAKFVNAR